MCQGEFAPADCGSRCRGRSAATATFLPPPHSHRVCRLLGIVPQLVQSEDGAMPWAEVEPATAAQLAAAHASELADMHRRFLATYTHASSAAGVPSSSSAVGSPGVFATVSGGPGVPLCDVPDDGYLYSHASYHLIEADQLPALRQLLTDPLWLERRLYAQVRAWGQTLRAALPVSLSLRLR